MGILRLVRCGAVRHALLAALVLPLAACAVGPDFIPPTAPITDKFLAANSRSIRSGHQDYRNWWKAFHDPTLNELCPDRLQPKSHFVERGDARAPGAGRAGHRH